MVGRWSDDALEWVREVEERRFLDFQNSRPARCRWRTRLGTPLPPTPPAGQPEIGSRSVVYQFDTTLLSVHPCALRLIRSLPMLRLTACNHSHRP